MSGMRGLNRASDSQSVFSRKHSHSRILEIDSWMPSEIQNVSPTVDRLMRLIEGSQCVHGAERNVELTLREALGRAVGHGNQAGRKTKIHIRCRDRKSTRLNSSHANISYAVFCLKNKNEHNHKNKTRNYGACLIKRRVTLQPARAGAPHSIEASPVQRSHDRHLRCTTASSTCDDR